LVPGIRIDLRVLFIRLGVLAGELWGCALPAPSTPSSPWYSFALPILGGSEVKGLTLTSLIDVPCAGEKCEDRPVRGDLFDLKQKVSSFEPEHHPHEILHALRVAFAAGSL
jgi:hypothetical protein